MLICNINRAETWILYRGGTDGVSKVVKDAYKKYLAMQNWKTEETKSDQRQRIKLISTTNKEVRSHFMYN